MYAKLFASLYQGTLRGCPDELLVFTNLLAHATATGEVDIHWNAISDETGLPVEKVKTALQTLEAPDLESRSPEHDGRRLIPLDEHRSWGWCIVNYAKYRAIRNEEDRRTQNRAAQERYRQKHNKPASAKRKQSKPRKPPSAQAEAEAYKIQTTSGEASPSPVLDPVWHVGLMMLGDTKASRSFLGQLCKNNGDEAARRAVALAVEKRPAEPMAFLMATAKGFKTKVDKGRAAMYVGSHENGHQPPPQPKCPICSDLGSYLPDREYKDWTEMKFEACPNGCPEKKLL